MTKCLSIAGFMEKPSIRPEAEVQAGNCRYSPCPIEEPPIDSRVFFHHFYTPASKHPDLMWGERLPRKVGHRLVPMDHGWGIHLEERPDWPLFAALMFLMLLFSGFVAGVYSWRTRDSQGGIVIGPWLSTVQGVGLSALFFW